MKLSIIVLNYKQKGHLRQLLRSFRDYNLPYEVEMIVIDNGSGDGVGEVVQGLAPNAVYVGLDRNVGYSAGNNVGLRRATGDYILIMNPDVAFFPGSIENLITYLEEHPEVGLVGPKLINPDGSTQLSGARFPNFWISLWRRSVFGNLPGPRDKLRAFLMEDWDRSTSRPVGWMLGAVLLLRRPAFEKVGLFDERFFLYLEDVDYCRRFWTMGWEVHYVADSEIVHYLSRESAVNPGLSAVLSYATRVHIRSWLEYFKKYRGHPKPPHSI